MKRAVLVLLAAAMLIAALPVCAFADDLSPGDIIFTMTDYRINRPSIDTLPFFKNGVLYVPASVFTDLGVTEIVVGEVYVSLANMEPNRILYFNIGSGEFYDENGEKHPLKPIKRGEIWFYPAFEVSDALGFVCAYYGEAKPAPFFRVTRADTDLSVTPQGYAAMAATMAWECLGVSLDGSDPGKITPEGRDYRPAIVVNGFTGAAEIAAALGKSSGAAAVFCVSAGEAAENIGACLRAAAAGCGFVLRGDGLDVLALASELKALNGVLRAAAGAVCRTVFFFSEPDGETKQAVWDMGCVSAWPEMDFRGDSFKDETVLTWVATATLAGALGIKTVILFDGESAAGAFAKLITEFDGHGCAYVTLSDVLVR